MIFLPSTSNSAFARPESSNLRSPSQPNIEISTIPPKVESVVFSVNSSINRPDEVDADTHAYFNCDSATAVPSCFTSAGKDNSAVSELEEDLEPHAASTDAERSVTPARANNLVVFFIEHLCFI